MNFGLVFGHSDRGALGTLGSPYICADRGTLGALGSPCICINRGTLGSLCIRVNYMHSRFSMYLC